MQDWVCPNIVPLHNKKLFALTLVALGFQQTSMSLQEFRAAKKNPREY